MKKILLFICLVTLALEVSASTGLHFIPNPSTTMDMTQLTTYVGETSGGKTLYFYHSGTSDVSSAIKISVKSAKALTGSSTIASSNYSFGTVSRQGSNSNNYYFEFTAKVAGVYTIYMYNQASETIYNATCTITVLNTTNLVYNNKTVSLTNPEHIVKLSDCKGSTNSSGTISYSWNGSTPTGAVLDKTTGTLSITEPGTYNLKASQAQTSTYFAATANFTITAYPPLYHKPMSCVINEIDLTDAAFDYPGYQNMDVDWAANARNLRYVKTNRTYTQIPQNYLNDQIVLKTSDASAVSSGKIVIGANDKIVSNPVISDEAQFDYVIPNNGNLALADGNNVTFTRNGFPGVNAKGQYTYGTICLPFDVAAGDMPSGFKFEEFKNNTMKDGTRFSVFQEVSSLQAGVPYLVYNTGSTSANLVITSDAASAWATNPTADSYYMGTFNDLIFDDINSNTAANPYNNTGAAADAHKGELNDFFAALYNYNSDGYLMANPGGDKIKRSVKSVRNKTMLRPFRAYFLLAKGAPASAMAMGVLHYSLDDELPTAISYLDAEGNQIDVVDVYTVSGVRVAKGKLQTEALNNLPAGLYILSNGKKVSKK